MKTFFELHGRKNRNDHERANQENTHNIHRDCNRCSAEDRKKTIEPFYRKPICFRRVFIDRNSKQSAPKDQGDKKCCAADETDRKNIGIRDCKNISKQIIDDIHVLPSNKAEKDNTKCESTEKKQRDDSLSG